MQKSPSEEGLRINPSAYSLIVVRCRVYEAKIRSYEELDKGNLIKIAYFFALASKKHYFYGIVTLNS